MVGRCRDFGSSTRLFYPADKTESDQNTVAREGATALILACCVNFVIHVAVPKMTRKPSSTNDESGILDYCAMLLVQLVEESQLSEQVYFIP